MIADALLRAEEGHPTKLATLGARRNAQIGKALVNARREAVSLYVATKSALWHMTGPHRFKYDAVLRRQADRLFETIGALSERLRRSGVEQVDHREFERCKRIDDIDFDTPEKLLNRLRVDNQILGGALRTVDILSREAGGAIDECYFDVWIQEARERAWSLLEATRLV